MRLLSVSINNFRNIEHISLSPGEKFNLLYGLNGQGKTNILEAIYMLGMPKSFRTSRFTDVIKHGENSALIGGVVKSGKIENKLRLGIESGGRKVEIDGKAVYKASELHGRLTSVIFSPDDTGMVKLGPETRRKYLDRAVYMGDSVYLHCWHSYQRILKQRNHLLKSENRGGLDIWTEQLAESGAEVIERRINFTRILNKKLKKYYETISGNSEIAELIYKPEGITSDNRNEIKKELIELLNKNQKIDERYGSTTAGPHRDDLYFELDSKPLKAFGSQGQQKSFILALKMSEMDNLQETFDEAPLLLLDDMSSELDAKRNHNLMEFLTKREIQVFITTTERSSTLLADAPQCAVFNIENGNLTFEGNQTHE